MKKQFTFGVCLLTFSWLVIGSFQVVAQTATDPVLVPGIAPIYYANASAISGDTLFVAGTFDLSVGIPGGVRASTVDLATGIPDENFPQPDGAVYAAIADGAGGWYLGGNFTEIGGQPRNGLARIKADGTVDNAWNPNANSGASIKALVLASGKVFIAGSFNSLGSQSYTAGASGNAVLGAVDATSAVPVGGFNPQFDGPIKELVPNGSTLYVSGEWMKINSTFHGRIAAFNTGDGSILSFDPIETGGMTINDMELDNENGILYVAGGNFTLKTVGGGTMEDPKLAAINLATGYAIEDWMPAPDNVVNCLKIHNNVLYVGGNFSNIATQSRTYLASFSLPDRTVSSWRPFVNNGSPLSFAVVNNTLYMYGEFVGVKKSITSAYYRQGAMAFNMETQTLTDWMVITDKSVLKDKDAPATTGIKAFTSGNGKLFVGGDFTAFFARGYNGLSAIDLRNGKLLPFNPGAINSFKTSRAYYSICVKGDTIFAGGNEISSIMTDEGAVTRTGLVAFNKRTGKLLDFNPVLSAGSYSLTINTLIAKDSLLYVGGYFTTVNGNSIKGLTAFNMNTGNLSSWRPNANDEVTKLVLKDTTLYAVGKFTQMNSVGRNYVAAFGVGTGAGTLTGWNPVPDGYVNALAVEDTLVYLGGSFTKVNNIARKNLAAVGAVSGNLMDWNPNADGAVNTLAAQDYSLFTGGAFANLGEGDFADTRNKLASIDLTASPVFTLNDWYPSGTDDIKNISLTGNYLVTTTDVVSLIGGKLQVYTVTPRAHLSATSVIKTVGDATFSPISSDQSATPVTYTIAEGDNTDGAISISEDQQQVQINNVGTAYVTASQEGSTGYDAAVPVRVKITVTGVPQSQTIENFVDITKTYDDTDFELTATASSGLDVTYSISDNTVATLSGSTVHILKVGETTITASQAGNENYEAAKDTTITLTINKASQIIEGLEDMVMDYEANKIFSLQGASTSGLPLVFSIDYDSIAVISGTAVMIMGTGVAHITASQAGNENYEATDSTITLTINKLTQTIGNFENITKRLGDADTTLAATATSDGVITYTVADGSVAEINGNILHLVGAGITTITASQSGNEIYQSISKTVTLTVTSTDKQDQSISNFSNVAKTFGDADFDLTATASSGLDVTYSSSDNTVATVTGNIVTIEGAGTTSIIATQSGNETYNAVSATVTLTVNKATQSISNFTDIDKRTSDADFALTATASSGLEVSYSITDESIATVNNGMVHIVTRGTTTITATQPGNNNYEAAQPVTVTLTVDFPDAVNDIEGDNAGLVIYPNPMTNGELTVEYPNAGKKAFMKITTVTGEQVLVQDLAQNSDRVVLPVHGFNSGIYFVAFSDENRQIVKKLIINK